MSLLQMYHFWPHGHPDGFQAMTSISVQPAPPQTQQPVSTKVSKSEMVILGVISLLGVLIACLDVPPAPSAEQGRPGHFSTDRALRHLEVVSRAPHPVGTAEHEHVKNYIVNSLVESGLSPEIQRTTAANQKAGVAATVENITAVVKGSGTGKCVLLVAHYDSVPTGPGASDDGAAVATLLEAARILRSRPQSKRDIRFLFTDGEEMGLLGAQAFILESPAARNIGIVLNFEARGTSGPVILFETSEQNEWLIQNFSKAVSRPVANSLSYEVYERLPNDTDFTVFKRAGYVGMNFAFIDGLVHYHTATDTAQNLDPGSLQHQGDYAVELAQWFGNLAQFDSRQSRTIYFDILGRVLVHYSFSVAIVAVILAVLLLAFALFRGFQKKYLATKSFGLGIVVITAGVLGAIAVAMLMQQTTEVLELRFPQIRAGALYHSGWYVASFVILGLATAVVAYSWGVKRLGAHNVAGAGLLVWLGLTLFCERRNARSRLPVDLAAAVQHNRLARCLTRQCKTRRHCACGSCFGHSHPAGASGS
jgi:hypothetical protein